MIPSNDFLRFAIYYVPPSSNQLTRFAASWLGWDVYKGIKVNYPMLDNLNYDIEAIIRSPSKYGLHGTLKPPFSLASDRTFDELRLSVLTLSRSIKKFEIPDISLKSISGFIAIVPTIQNESIKYLARKCLEELDSFRAFESPEILNKRRFTGLSTSQECHLLKWGYPYVQDDFMFHLTMTSKLTSEVSEISIDPLTN